MIARCGWAHPAYAVTYRGGKLHRAVRDDRFLYAEFDSGRQGAMLIDLKNDPRELTNCVTKVRGDWKLLQNDAFSPLELYL